MRTTVTRRVATAVVAATLALGATACDSTEEEDAVEDPTETELVPGETEEATEESS